MLPAEDVRSTGPRSAKPCRSGRALSLQNDGGRRTGAISSAHRKFREQMSILHDNPNAVRAPRNGDAPVEVPFSARLKSLLMFSAAAPLALVVHLLFSKKKPPLEADPYTI